MTTGSLDAALRDLLHRLPDPAASEQVAQFEAELAEAFGAGQAIAVSSGTVAIHTALVAVGVRPGDEVIVPAACVPMSVAPIVHAGATPVYIDTSPDGRDLDRDDLAAKVSSRTSAVLAVYLWGRTGTGPALAEAAASHGFAFVEDACQAHGSRRDGKLLGTLGDAGCLSLRDGKILWSGEGGAVLTDDTDLAVFARGFRTHWQAPGTPPPGLTGHNYRLAEPLAAIARANLARFDHLLAQRRRQTRLLQDRLSSAPGLGAFDDEHGWNGYSPLMRITLPEPRAFSRRVAERGVPNSVGTFGLTACDRHPVLGSPTGAGCEGAAAYIDGTLAIVVTERDSDEQLERYADIVTEEAASWAPC